MTAAGDNPHFQSFNGMLFSADLTILHLVPEGMEGVAVLPESLATVPAYVISRCKKLFGLTFLPSGSTGNNAFTAQDGVLYTADKTTLLAAPAGLGASISIAPECTAIAEGAFWGNEKLKTIIATGNVAEISVASKNDEGANGSSILGAAFEQATIENATVITDNREAWEAAGFTNFAKPAEPGDTIAPAPGDSGFTYTLMDNGQLSVKWTGDAPASGKRNIPSAATLHGVDYTVSVIEDGAFKGQTDLAEIVLPDTITTIGENAFAGCTALESIQLPGSVTSIGASAFEGCTALATITLGAGLRTISEHAFAETALSTITLPAAVQTVGEAAFADCESLRTIVVLGSIEDVSSAALQGVSGIDIYLPYRADSAYSWSAGAPAAGNHLMPYGAAAPASELQLSAGQTGDLFADGGYLEAPGDIDVQLSYNAKSISVGTDGAVSAIQPGISTVTVRLMLGDTLLANTTRTVRISHAAVPPTQEDAAQGSDAESETTESEDISDLAEPVDPATQPAGSTATDTEDADGASGAQPPTYNADVPLDTTDTAQPDDAIITRPQIEAGSYLVDEEAFTKEPQPTPEDQAAPEEEEPEPAPEEPTETFEGTTAGPVNPIEPLPEKTPSETPATSAVALLSGTKTLLSGYLDSNDKALTTTLDSDPLQTAEATPAAIEAIHQLVDLASESDAVIDARATDTANRYKNVYVNPNGGTIEFHWCDYGWDYAVLNQNIIAAPFGNISSTTAVWHNGQKQFINLTTSSGVTSAHFGSTRILEGGEQPSKSVIDRSTCYQASRGGYMFKGVTKRKGYNATKWYVVGTGETVPSNAPLTDYAGKTLAVAWEPREFTITYNISNCTVDSSSAKVKYDSAYPAIIAPTPNPGYEFKGFYTEPNGKGTLVYDAAGNRKLTSYTTEGNQTLYAHVVPTTYTMTFKGEEGTFDRQNEKKITFDITTDTISFPKPSHQYDDVEFVGWVITGDMVTAGSGSLIEGYTAGDPTDLMKLTGRGHWGDATAQAIWRYTLTIDRSLPEKSPGGTNNTNDYAYFYRCPATGNTETFWSKSSVSGSRLKTVGKLNWATGTNVTTKPTANGYKLLGFYTYNNGGTEFLDENGNFQAPYALSFSRTIYARWEVVEYKIYLNASGGRIPGTSYEGQSRTLTYTVEDNTLKNSNNDTDDLGLTPTRSKNWIFVGWKGSKSSSSPASDSWLTDNKPHYNWCANSAVYGDYSLTAIWRKDCTLNYNGPINPPTPTTVTAHTPTEFYFFTDYGVSWSSSPVFGDSSSSFITNIFSGEYSAPAISDDGWELHCFVGEYFSATTAHPRSYIASDGAINLYNMAAYMPDNGGFYSHWEGKTYTITLNPNPSGSTDAVQSGTTAIKYKYGTNYHVVSGTQQFVYLPDCGYGYDVDGQFPTIPIPTKEGWTFNGYYWPDNVFTNNGSGRAYRTCESSAGGCFGDTKIKHLESVGVNLFHNNPSVLKGNITLTAKWQRTIPINAMGGTLGKEKSVTVNYGGSLPETLSSDYTPTAPTDAEWSLAGFYDVNTAFKQLYSWDHTGSSPRFNRTFSSAITTTKDPTELEALWYRYIKIDLNGGKAGKTLLDVYRPWGLTALTSEQVKTYERDGYTFAGIATESDGGILSHNANGTNTYNVTSINCPATLYVQWEPEEATIEFDANGGTGGPAAIVGETDQKITDRTLPTEAPTKPDYTFSHWSTDREGTDRIDQLPEKFPAGTTTYYAQYTEKPASIIRVGVWGDDYSSGGTFGFGPEGDYYDYTVLWQYVKPDTGELNNPIYIKPNEGYEFEAWYEFDFYGNRTFISDDIAWRPERPESGWPGETVFLIKFKQKEYSITYGCYVCRQPLEDKHLPCKHVYALDHFVDGSSTAVDLPKTFKYENTVDEAKAITLGTPYMQSQYYEFAGWSGTDVPEGTPTSFQISTLGNKIYYIHPKAKEYTLTLDANTNTSSGRPSGGWSTLPEGYMEAASTGDHPCIKRSYTVETKAFQLPQPVWAGHTFDHWENRNGQPVSETFAPGYGNYGDQTLHAVWSSNPYQITYQLGDDDGSNAGWLPEGTDNPHNYDFSSDDITLPIPSRIGYDFIGWTETIEEEDPPSGLEGQSPLPAVKGDSPQIDVTIPSGSWGNRTYKAHWRAHEYNIAYDLDGGAWEDPQPDNPQVATHDQDVTLAKAPKRAGYLFQGWQFVRTEGETQAIERYEAGQSVARPNFTEQVGEPAYEGVSANKGATATIEALWLPNLSVDVVVGGQGVHMGLQLKADPDEPFETTRGEAVLKNRSDAPLKVVEVAPNAASDYEALKTSALELFLTEESLEQAAFMVRPSKGSAANTQTGWFGIADPEGALVLRDEIGLNSPTPNCPRNWYMGTADESTNELKLYYQLDMGDLRPEDVDISEDKVLHVADLRYTVALVLP